MVEPMSPRLTSSRTIASACWDCAMTFSSTATPFEPCRSKKADCGLSTAISPASASTQVMANRSRPAASSARPHFSSRPGCGSMPTHSGPRSETIVVSRAPNGAIIAFLLRYGSDTALRLQALLQRLQWTDVYFAPDQGLDALYGRCG